MDLYVCGRRVRVWTSGMKKEGLDTGKKINLGSFFLKLFLFFVYNICTCIGDLYTHARAEGF